MTRQRLASAVVARRIQLGHRTREALAAASGLSHRTLSYIEQGSTRTYNPGTIAQLEHALRWLPGSVAAILDGGDPTPEPEPQHDLPEPLARLVAAYGALGPRDRELLLATVEIALTWAEGRAHRTRESSPAPNAAPGTTQG